MRRFTSKSADVPWLWWHTSVITGGNASIAATFRVASGGPRSRTSYTLRSHLISSLLSIACYSVGLSWSRSNLRSHWPIIGQDLEAWTLSVSSSPWRNRLQTSSQIPIHSQMKTMGSRSQHSTSMPCQTKTILFKFKTVTQLIRTLACFLRNTVIVQLALSWKSQSIWVVQLKSKIFRQRGLLGTSPLRSLTSL